MRSTYLLRVVSPRVLKRGKKTCKEKRHSRILLCRHGLLPLLLRMKPAHLPTLVEILGSIHGYLLYNGLRGLLERGNYLLRLLGTCETGLLKPYVVRVDYLPPTKNSVLSSRNLDTGPHHLIQSVNSLRRFVVP